MVEGIRMKEISVSGFRGYGEVPETIDLSQPVVILMGGNRSGKSSTMNAIEWAIYGDEVVGAGKVGIQERKGWLVTNRNCEKARVELVLESSKGQLKVVRETTAGRKKKGKNFFYTDESGNKHTDEESLWNRLGLGARDFMSSVYLHQEVIRDIIVSVPSVRKEALDRLLGVSHLRNLFDAFKDVKIGKYEKEITKAYENVEGLVDAKASFCRNSVKEEMENGAELGLEKEDFNKNGFNTKCEGSLKILQTLSKKARIKPAKIGLPDTVEEYDEFIDEIKNEIDRLRAEGPGMESQRNLDEQQRNLDSSLSEYISKRDDLKDINKEKKDIEKDVGPLKAIEEKRNELKKSIEKVTSELEKISDRINVVSETIRYLAKIEDKKKKAMCPACEQDIVPAKVLKSLEEMKEKIKSRTETLEETKQKNRNAIKALDNSSERLKEIVEEEIPELKEDKNEAIKTLEEILGRKLTREEDPEAVVRKRLKEIEEEIENNKKALTKHLEKITEFEKSLEVVECVGEVLSLKEKIKRLNAIKKTKEWSDLNEARDGLNDELERVKIVKDSVESVLREKSREKIHESKGHIKNIYQDLVERPDFEWIEIDPENFDVYAVTKDNREKLLTFFNQGDMNCAALSIFLALGKGPEVTCAPGFLMLDDPSQSLDLEQKKRLSKILDEVAKQRQVLLSTMDGELYQNVKKEITSKKKVYELGKWDPLKGPSISEA